MKEYHIHNSTVRIMFGSVLESRAEVMVSCDGSTIRMSGGGVAQAIRQAGGDIIREDAQNKLPARLGDVIVTTAGHLPQKYVFHCITLDRSGDKSDTPADVPKENIHQYIIGHSIDKCFQLMQAIGLSSIVFPSIGTGAAGISTEMAAEVMAEAMSRNLMKTNKQLSVEIYLFDRYGEKGNWDYLPFFEHFASHEALSKLTQQQVSSKLQYDTSKSFQETSQPMPENDHDVFISYSRKDSETVKAIYERLMNSGIRCWLDVDGMYSGVSFKKVVVDAVKRAKVVLFMSSENSNKSRNVVSEISIAVENEKRIIPVRLDMSPYSESIEYDLVNHDYVVYDAVCLEESYNLLITRLVSTMKMMG